MKAGESGRRNMRLLSRFLLTLTGMVIVFTIVFHTLMAWEGQEHSWITGFYWSFTVMSTLGFGDITFQSDIGRIFSIFVLLSGVIFLLILLPFTLIEFFYAPWVESRSRRIIQHSLPDTASGHVILLSYEICQLTIVWPHFYELGITTLDDIAFRNLPDMLESIKRNRFD